MTFRPIQLGAEHKFVTICIVMSVQHWVTMPKATDEWYFSSALYCGDDVCKPSLYTALNMTCTNTDSARLAALILSLWIYFKITCSWIGFPIDYWTTPSTFPFPAGSLCQSWSRMYSWRKSLWRTLCRSLGPATRPASMREERTSWRRCTQRGTCWPFYKRWEGQYSSLWCLLIIACATTL